MKAPNGPGSSTAGVVSAKELVAEEVSHGKRHAWKRTKLGEAAGSRKLGCSLYEIPPGKAHFPFHGHFANEEAIYVLEGRGTLRLADGDRPLLAGDYAAFPVGPGGAHQVRNDSDAPLRFLCVSTMIEPDIAFQPDSDKVLLFAGAAPGGDKERRTLTRFLSGKATVEYWDGEGD